MPSTFEINATSGRYSVTVGRDLVADVVAKYPNAVYIIDSKLTGTIPEHVTRRISVDAEEHNKSLEYMPEVIAKLRQLNATRDTHIVAVGGGIIQDITTFVASIYMRGLPWTYLATTVLSMVDSCIGGKSSVNVYNYKNLVGNFYPPKEVIIDTNYISTLDKEMVVGGLYEAAKICYARGYDQFRRYLSFEPGYPLESDKSPDVILCSLETKRWFIEIDEFDQKERLLLNFGHTFGHAIEGGTNFGISHGIGVGVGMLAACHFARQTNDLSPIGLQRIGELNEHIQATLLPAQGPVIANPPLMELDVILEKFEYDKKHRQTAYKLVLPQKDGGLELVSRPRDAETRAAARAAFAAAFAQLGWASH